jgi:hypothetical protein
MCMRDGVNLVIGYTYHLQKQPVTTGNCNSLTGLRTHKVNLNAAHMKPSMFTSRFPVTDFNTVLCLRPSPLANFPHLDSAQLFYNWRQAPWDPSPDLFFTWTFAVNSPYVASSLTRRWVRLLWICLAFRHVYISHVYHATDNSSIYTMNKSFISTGFAKHIMST